MHKVILVTGGYGFIGANYIIEAAKTANLIINIDNITYAASPIAVREHRKIQNLKSYKLSINDADQIFELIQKYRPTLIVNFAAESHVDNSIANPRIFMETNIFGTFNLLNVINRYRDINPYNEMLFHHISTDEVYGSLNFTDDETFTEDTLYDPASPYSASKASSEMLINAWSKTYGIDVLCTNCSNNYGPYQHNEKLIPMIIKNATSMQKIPIYGNGLNIRDWLFVRDHVNALILLQNSKRCYNRYNIGGNNEFHNLDVVKVVLEKLSQKLGRKGEDLLKLVEFTEDRKGHDIRYGVNIDRISQEFGWKPRISFASGISETIDWFLAQLNRGEL